MALVSKSELTDILRKQVPRIPVPGRLNTGTEEEQQTRQTLQQQAAEDMRKLGA